MSPVVGNAMISARVVGAMNTLTIQKDGRPPVGGIGERDGGSFFGINRFEQPCDGMFLVPPKKFR